MGRLSWMSGTVAVIAVVAAGELLTSGDGPERGELRAGQQTPVVAKPTAPATPESTKPAATVPPTPKHALEKADLEAFFDGIVPLQLERSDVAGATVLVMKDGQTLLKKGY